MLIERFNIILKVLCVSQEQLNTLHVYYLILNALILFKDEVFRNYSNQVNFVLLLF